MTIIELKKKPLPSQQAKLDVLMTLIEIVESIDKKDDIEKLKKSQTIRLTSKKGNTFIFTITLI
jgi:hypothetical protein